MEYPDHEFDPAAAAARAEAEREAELARKIRREVRRVQSGEADEDLRADREREEAEREEAAARDERDRRRHSRLWWLWVTGGILLRDGVTGYYHYLIAIAVTFLTSIAVMFMTLHLDVQHSRLKVDVQRLRERSIRLEEQKFRQTSHSAIQERLRAHGIELCDPLTPGEAVAQ